MDYKNKKYHAFIKHNKHLFSDEEVLWAKRMRKNAKYEAKQQLKEENKE